MSYTACGEINVRDKRRAIAMSLWFRLWQILTIFNET